MSAETTEALKVLVAEDEPAMLTLVARHMRSLGFKVIEASEGDAAWDLARRHHPDLVILDVMMPGMSGWEICKRLKGLSNGEFSDTGVIMLTGIGENLNEMTSPLFAADAWLNKPFEFTELDAKIKETLARYSKQPPLQNGQAGPAAVGEVEGPLSEVSVLAKAPPPEARPAKKPAAEAKAAPKAPAKKASKKAAPKKAAAKAGKAAPAKKVSKKAAAAKARAGAKGGAKKGAPKKAPKKSASKKATKKKGARRR